MLAQRILHGACNGQEKQYVDDVFSTYLYTGNGSTQTITNGIDLAGKGGLVWIKGRSGATNHQLFDTARTATYELISNSTAAQVAGTDTLTAFNSTGFALGADATTNTNAATYASWTFRKAPKFFDVVTYTGNGVAGRQIPHGLGIAPGFITTKSTSTTDDWNSYHRSATGDLVLNSTAAQTGSRAIITAADSSTFTVSGVANTNGVQYVAYLFAHDPDADGIIQAGSFTTDASGNATVNLWWEPQYVLYKASGTTSGWGMLDSMRGMPVGGVDPYLVANSANDETGNGNIDRVDATATGFNVKAYLASTTTIYLAIRRPNKPPTTGTQVYNAIARTGTGVATTVTGVGFAPDLFISKTRPYALNNVFFDRLRGLNFLVSNLAGTETATSNSVTEYGNDGVTFGADPNYATVNFTYPYINHFFRRAPGFMDTICFTGTGSNKTESHSLGKAPELWVVKGRSGATPWVWGSSLLANTENIVMPSPAGKVTDATAWNSTYPTASVISLGTAAAVNTSSATYVCYLWATVAGISKVFSYTGDGGSGKVINCGFSAGARFVLIVRTDTTGSFLIWDSVRGIVAANDPHLALDTTAAEVTTDDSVDPDSTGFAVNQVAATDINVNGATYIGLAIA